MREYMRKMKKSLSSLPLYIKIAGAVCLALAVATLLAFVLPTPSAQGEFVPPAFESAAMQGKPQPPEALVYRELWQGGMHFSVWLCCAPVQENGAAQVYFTNPAENAVWMKLRLLDEQGNTVGESGLLRPGEYVESVALTQALSAGDAIKLKIMTYEPETYNSMGSVSINTTLGE